MNAEIVEYLYRIVQKAEPLALMYLPKPLCFNLPIKRKR